ncbi:MAG: tRNA 2-thiouridine(34) synthase MnmA, partial [Planctomycetota bacterium]
MSIPVAVALSGGVDSTMAAALLVEQGYRVRGLTMDLGPVFGAEANRRRRTIDSAREAARAVGVPLEVVDLSGAFEQVLDYFVDDYLAGRTPNPCTRCNPQVKFGLLMQAALDRGAELFATGHYGRVLDDPNGPQLHRGLDPDKDQSYVLFGIPRPRLKQILFPLGHLTKDEVRRRAREMDLEVADRAGSQDICFIDNAEGHASFIEARRPGSLRPGPVVDLDGNVLGSHPGVARFTLGQRRGLNVAVGHPVYVVDIRPSTATVVVGTEDDLMSDRLVVDGMNWLCELPTEPFDAQVKIRYRSPARIATVHPLDDDASRVEVTFEQPVKAA